MTAVERDFLDLGVGFSHEVAQGAGVRRHLLVGNREKKLFGLAHNVFDVIGGRIKRKCRDGGRGGNKPAQNGVALDNVGMVAPVDQGKGVVGEVDNERRASHSGKVA